MTEPIDLRNPAERERLREIYEAHRRPSSFLCGCSSCRTGRAEKAIDAIPAALNLIEALMTEPIPDLQELVHHWPIYDNKHPLLYVQVSDAEQLLERIKELEAENARLAHVLGRVKIHGGDWVDCLEKLEVENAVLREQLAALKDLLADADRWAEVHRAEKIELLDELRRSKEASK